MTDGDTSGMVRSDLRLFDIIEQLHELDEAGVTELAERLELPKSTVHKHLKTLKHRQFVHNDGGTYHLSLKFLEYGGNVRNRSRIHRLTRGKLEALSDEVNGMLMASLREYDYGVITFSTNDRFALVNLVPVGQRVFLHQNAAGKVMLATLSEEKVKAYAARTGLPPAMEKTTTNVQELLEELDRIQENGYAVSRGERFEGIRAVSTAVGDPEIGSLASISVVVPNEAPIADELETKYAEQLVLAARDITLQLKYGDNSDVPSE